MHCELAIPGLFGAAKGLRLGAAEMLLARGRQSRPEPAPLEQWLIESFGDPEEEKTELACPAGALSLLAHGGEPGDADWARADPVHLQLMRDRVVLVPGEAFSLSRQEADALCATLNERLAGRLEVRALEPLRWVARLALPVPLETAPALPMAGLDVAPRRPGDALANEIQMALHEHPVNEAREARGEPSVNSLWLWGAGKLPASPPAAPPGHPARWQSVASSDPLALGLTRVAGARGRPLPASAQAWLELLPGEGRHLAVLDALLVPLALGNAQACRERSEALDQAWLAPLLQALRDGRIGMVTIHVPNAGVSVETIRGDLRRFWRLARPISTMAP